MLSDDWLKPKKVIARVESIAKRGVRITEKFGKGSAKSSQ